MKVGILGGGQLARMLILDGSRLNMSFRIYDAKPHSSTADLVEFHTGDFLDEDSLLQFAKGLDVITSEFENIPAKTLEILERSLPCYPGWKALSTAQDRLSEKSMFNELAIPTTKFFAVSEKSDLLEAAGALGYPFVLKQRSLGYDGKGQCVLRDETELDVAWEDLGAAPLIAEEFIRFERELSCVAVFGRNKEIVTYPLIENVHENGILKTSTAPAKVSEDIASQARHAITSIAKQLEYVGVLVVEFFERDGELLANEIAPRVHNSGHLTIEGATTSQFENHLRAIAGLPLGATAINSTVVMHNIISDIDPLASYLQDESVSLHLYNKEPAPGRKLGHWTRPQ
jgi:5-(carboxyamino)imidazole ribonucleotide synthase